MAWRDHEKGDFGRPFLFLLPLHLRTRARFGLSHDKSFQGDQ